MNRVSEGAERLRGTGAPVALAWLFVLVTLVSCCATQPVRPHPSPEFAPASALATQTDLTVVRVVTADAPGDRGVGDSCHDASQHSAPVVLPAQPGPAAVPSTAVALLPHRPLTGGESIRGPSNDAVGEVDPLRLQVQRT
ncbi:hypothetical protein FKN01_11750 [Streptomyces sp. 130]|uniref:hypothetical protein n=1 Tax=Streptomyces sp. 130 TaxID=2591006 RepID=UPI00118121C7|nr:hypothetical protein [Streptomyces sp. 130]TRV78854.1 hypothetical protein FKN01_11750 [Streptomyces sp. 130]